MAWGSRKGRMACLSQSIHIWMASIKHLATDTTVVIEICGVLENGSTAWFVSHQTLEVVKIERTFAFGGLLLVQWLSHWVSKQLCFTHRYICTVHRFTVLRDYIFKPAGGKQLDWQLEVDWYRFTSHLQLPALPFINTTGYHVNDRCIKRGDFMVLLVGKLVWHVT